MPPRPLLECYKVLGVPYGASKETVRKAYVELVKKWHPDKERHSEKQDEAQEKIKQINAAYEQIQKSWPEIETGDSGFDPEDIEEVAGFSGVRPPVTPARRPSPTRMLLLILVILVVAAGTIKVFSGMIHRVLGEPDSHHGEETGADWFPAAGEGISKFRPYTPTGIGATVLRCSKCGHEQTNQRYCSKCGNRL